MNKKLVRIIFSVLGLALVAGAVYFFLIREESSVLEQSLVEDTRCYGTREFTQYGATDPGGFSYQFAHFSFNEDDSVEGELAYYPYGIDSAEGSFTGSYDRASDTMEGIYDFYAEGDQYQEERKIQFNEDGILFGFGPMTQGDDGVYRYNLDSQIDFDYPLPLISCQRYRAWQEEYRSGSSE